MSTIRAVAFDIDAQRRERLDEILLSHIAGFTVLILKSAASVIDVALRATVLELLEFLVGGDAGSAEAARHELREGEFFRLSPGGVRSYWDGRRGGYVALSSARKSD